MSDKLVDSVIVTLGKRPRYSYWSRGRLWPLCREAAEASFAAGATVYSKQPGEPAWAVDVAVFDA